MVNFYLVRHGQSLGNVDFSAHREYGDPRLPLTALGVIQAGCTAQFLRDILFKEQAESGKKQKILLIHSTFERAWHTADFIDTALDSDNFDLIRDQHIALREQSYGIWDGLEESEYEAVAPHAEKLWRQLRSQNLKFYAPMPGGESSADVWGRVKSEALPSIMRTIEQDGITDVIIVSHGLTTRATIAALVKPAEPLHDYYNRFKNPPNASVHLITPDPDYKRGQTRRHGSKYKHSAIIYDPNLYLKNFAEQLSPEELAAPERQFSKIFEPRMGMNSPIPDMISADGRNIPSLTNAEIFETLDREDNRV